MQSEKVQGRRSAWVLVCAGLSLLGASFHVRAMPAFTVQTGDTCAQCHTSAFGPALTQRGREFKLNGFSAGKYNIVPLSATAIGSFAHLNEDAPSPPHPSLSLNDNAVLNEASLFLASRITKRSGGYLSATYDRLNAHTRWDDIDVRYVHPFSIGEKASLLTGVTVNNNPTVQDLWNSAPAKRYPYVDTGMLPTPAAAPLIDGALSHQVLGTSIYAMLNDHYYLEVGAYRGLSGNWLDKMGMDPDASLHPEDVLPYWRAVAQRSFGRHRFSLGLMSLTVNLKPDSAIAESDRYVDEGIDATYEFIDSLNNALNVNLAWLHERRNLEASAALGLSDDVRNDLYTRRVDVTYSYDQTMVISGGWFDTKGTTNTLLWTPAPYTGSANGSPNTRGYSVQFEFIPFGKTTSPVYTHFNFRLGLRYTTYDFFNGGELDYDGSGRSASDNESVFGFAWLAF